MGGAILFAARFSEPMCYAHLHALGADNWTWAAARMRRPFMQPLWLGSATWSATDPAQAGFAAETVQPGPPMAEQSMVIHAIGVSAGYLDTLQTVMNSW